MIIYNKNGVVFLDTVVDDSSFLYNEICGSEYVRLDFSLTEYAEIPLGAYIIHRDVRYTLHEAPTIEMVSQEEYKITATFEAPAKQLELYSLRNHVDKRVDFMLTAKPAEHVGMVLEALRVRDKAWAIGNCIDAAEKTITYSYVSCMEALQMIADAFDTEWEIIDHTINLGKVEHLNDAPLRLSYGKDFGLNPGVGRANLGEARISAVYPQGTDRNINASTYGNTTLLLPKDQLIGYDGYRFDDELGYDKSNAVLYSTDIWGTCVYSASSSGVEAEGVLDCTEIYPQREGTVTNVVVRNADSNLYDIQDNTIPNSLDYQAVIIPGNELSIVFQTGMLAGKEFGASYIHNGATDSTKRLFQIRPQEYDGVMMPGGNYMPQVGDKYAVFGVALPESYLADNDSKTGASWDMLRKCVKHLYEAEKPQYSFTGELSSKWLRQEISRVSPYLRIGAVISFGRVAFQPEAVLVRIESIKQYINTPYAVELSFGDRVIPTPYKITSKAVESRRAVEVRRIASQTAMQLNAVKQNAVAPPPVNDTVPFANDLTGVIEATPEEFTYRPSAGNTSIRDASAVIRRIKGNTTVWTQCCKNPYLELDKLYNKNQSNASYTNTDGGLRITYNSDGNPPDFYLFSTQLGNLVKGHIYMISIDARVSGGLNVEMSLYSNYDTALQFYPNGEWNRYAGLYTLTRDTFTSYYYVGIRERTTTTIHAGDYFEFRNAQFIDLTRLFDAGNESTTYEDFKALYPDVYPYCEPEVRNVITNQITTIGFNQWDERWELGALGTNNGAPVDHNERGRSVNFFDVIPNASYYCATIAPITTNSGGTVGSMLVWWYDSNYTMIKYADITNKTCVAPSNARYAKICSYGGDVNAIFNGGVNINLSHSGVRDGEYEPYKRNIRLLPEIYKYFPYGMNGNAKVWDEINAEYAIKRWGVVDLGTLTWSAQGTNTSGEYRWEAKGISTPPTATVSTIPNIICAKYTTGSNENTFARKDCVSISASGNIRIFDSNYKEASSKEAFVASLQGVLLYYELAKPIETPITEAIQLDYEVYDFGTEKASAFGNSAPFRADIVYQFNAEGRIRDNSRNIERVESTITTRLIPSQTAMLGLPNKVMTWDGNKTLMSLPIAESIAEWEMEESPLGVLPTGKQVKEYVALNAGGGSATSLFPQKQWSDTNLIPVASNVVTVLTIPEGTTDAIGVFISDNDVNMVLGKDNEWALRFQVPSTGVTLDIKPLSAGKELRWANGEEPTWEAGKIYECSFRLYGDVFLGVWSSF